MNALWSRGNRGGEGGERGGGRGEGGMIEERESGGGKWDKKGEGEIRRGGIEEKGGGILKLRDLKVEEGEGRRVGGLGGRGSEWEEYRG